MKKYILAALIAVSGWAAGSQAQIDNAQIPDSYGKKPGEAMKQAKTIATVKMIFNNEEIKVDIHDSPASREFLAMLPLTLEFDDFAGAEKIACLPSKLTEKGVGSKEAKGDFTYYVPWGNLAVFYKGYGASSGLYIMGRIVSGKERLAKMDRSFTATIEKM